MERPKIEDYPEGVITDDGYEGREAFQEALEAYANWLEEKNEDDNNGWQMDYDKTIKQDQQIAELKEALDKQYDEGYKEGFRNGQKE